MYTCASLSAYTLVDHQGVQSIGVDQDSNYARAKTIWPGQWSNSASYNLDNEQRLLMLTLLMIMLMILLMLILLLLQNNF